jgi:spore coat polysaccharide biosynthesis protein SpsF
MVLTMMLNKGLIIFSRLDSKRFPYKAFAKLGNKTIIEWIISNLKVNLNYKVILATSNREVDRPLVDFARESGISYFQGPLDDVACRTLGCIKEFELDYFARINGDSPFVNKELIIEGFDIISRGNIDFVTNLVPRRFPYGTSVEIVKSSTFCSIYKYFSDNDKEHITSYFYEHFNDFNTFCIEYKYGNDHDVRLVIDTIEDLEILKKILSRIDNIESIKIPDIVKIYREVII